MLQKTVGLSCVPAAVPDNSLSWYCLFFLSLSRCCCLVCFLSGILFLREQVVLDPYLLLDLIADLRMILKIDLDILTSLTDPLTVVRVPCAALIDYIALCCKIQDLTLSGDTCTKHDIKFCLLEWRCNLVLTTLTLVWLPTISPPCLRVSVLLTSIRTDA